MWVDFFPGCIPISYWVFEWQLSALNIAQYSSAGHSVHICWFTDWILTRLIKCKYRSYVVCTEDFFSCFVVISYNFYSFIFCYASVSFIPVLFLFILFYYIGTNLIPYWSKEESSLRINIFGQFDILMLKMTQNWGDTFPKAVNIRTFPI